MKRMILAGANGFLGGVLARYFGRRGWTIVGLTRRPGTGSVPAGVREVAWDGANVGAWAAELEGADVVVNLAGRSVDCRYTEPNRRAIWNSRVDATRAIGSAIARCQTPPAVWLNAGTATIYRHSLEQPMGEDGVIAGTPGIKDEFSVAVAQAWEAALAEAATPRTRRVSMRLAMVLGRGSEGVLPVLRRLARRGLGGTMGDGRQYVSWLHEADFCRAVEWLIEHPELAGAVNVTSPQPLPNEMMMRQLREQVRAPFGLPATKWMLEIGAIFLRTETELILKSRRVVPARLQASGFRFEFPEFAGAVADLAGPACA